MPRKELLVWDIVRSAMQNNCGTSLSTSWVSFSRGGEMMPKKPKRPCSYPGCPKLTDGRFCDEHAKEEAKRYERYDRDPAVRRRYGRAWKRIRDRFISAHPLCEECKKQGKLTPAQEVHHILPISRGGTHAENNLMALCKSCHSEITARDGDRWHDR